MQKGKALCSCLLQRGSRGSDEWNTSDFISKQFRRTNEYSKPKLRKTEMRFCFKLCMSFAENCCFSMRKLHWRSWGFHSFLNVCMHAYTHTPSLLIYIMNSKLDHSLCLKQLYIGWLITKMLGMEKRILAHLILKFIQSHLKKNPIEIETESTKSLCLCKVKPMLH